MLGDFASMGDISYCKSVMSISAAAVGIGRCRHRGEDTFLCVLRAFLELVSHNCIQVPKKFAALESEVCLSYTALPKCLLTSGKIKLRWFSFLNGRSPLGILSMGFESFKMIWIWLRFPHLCHSQMGILGHAQAAWTVRVLYKLW